MLVWAFVREFNETMGKRISRIRKNDMAELQSYSWPGNIRELRNVIEHAVIVSQGEELKVRLPENGRNNAALALSLQELESRHIEEILRQTGGRIKGDGGAAGILGLNAATLYSRMKKLGISSRREKDGM
jgi:DNA-binding NtrC family response regulator